MEEFKKNEYNPYALGYLVIPDYVYKDSRLTLIALKVYGFIHSYTNPFFFGNDNISKMFNCSERSITEALSKLEEYGYIKMKHTPKAGGGTTRLAVDCYSDWKSTSSRKQKFEASTSSALLHKDIKDNNIKGSNEPSVNKEEVGNSTDPTNIQTVVGSSYEDWKALKAQKKADKEKKSYGFGGAARKEARPERSQKGVAYGENIR